MSTPTEAAVCERDDLAGAQTRLGRRFLYRSLMAAAIAGLVGDRIWRDHHPPPERFVYTDGKHTYGIAPLDAPVMSDADLVLWTLRAVIAAYSVDFTAYDDQFSRASALFTVRGWQGFNSEYVAGNRDALTHARLVATAQPYAAATIRERAMIGGTLTYVVEIPLIVTYMNENTAVAQKLLVTARVVRARVTEHPDGVAIDQINALRQ